MKKKHLPVLLQEIIDFVPSKKEISVIDCTTGLGGHLINIVQKSCTQSRFLAFDQDKNNLDFAKNRLKSYKNQLIFVHSNFKNLLQYARNHEFENSDFILLDLGLSSPHVDEAERGFSFKKNGPLDMRFNQETGLTAAEIINQSSFSDLCQIFRQYGELNTAPRIAKAISSAREENKIKTTLELAEIIKKSFPENKHNKILTLVFQALRIEVNDELTVLKQVLDDAISLLAPQGRIAVISYHSLEDRIVKQSFRYWSADCHCNKKSPICTCHFQPQLKIITSKAIVPTETEQETNPRSRSAKLRVAEKYT